MKKTYLAVCLSTLLITTGVQASDTGKFYVGTSFGKMELGDGDFSVDDTTFKLFAGYQVNPAIAIEGHYASMNIDASEFGTIGSSVDISSVGVSGLYSFTQDKKFSPFLKLGLNNATASVDVSGADLSVTETKLSYGLGANIKATNNLSIRAEYELFASDFDMISAGVSYAFLMLISSLVTFIS